MVPYSRYIGPAGTAPLVSRTRMLRDVACGAQDGSSHKVVETIRLGVAYVTYYGGLFRWDLPGGLAVDASGKYRLWHTPLH